MTARISSDFKKGMIARASKVPSTKNPYDAGFWASEWQAGWEFQQLVQYALKLERVSND